MFNIALSEGLIIVIAIILFVRPADYPRLLRTLGTGYAKAMRMYYAIIDELYALAPSPIDEVKLNTPKQGVSGKKQSTKRATGTNMRQENKDS